MGPPVQYGACLIWSWKEPLSQARSHLAFADFAVGRRWINRFAAHPFIRSLQQFDLELSPFQRSFL